MRGLASFIDGFREPKPERLAGLPDCFEHELLRRRGARELAIVLSPAKKLPRYVSGGRRSLLYLSDPAQEFYVRGAEATAEAVCDLVEADNIAKTIFVGGSKAGYGALIMTALCARALPERDFRCLGLSPHTSIYPENPNLAALYLNYRRFIERAGREKELRDLLTRLGDARICEGLPNAFVTVVYGEANRVDREEAARLTAFNVRKYPVPFAFHSTKTALVIKEQPPERRRAAVEKIFATMQRSEETRNSIPPTPELLAEEIERTRWLPSMTELIDEVMSR